MPLDAYTPNQTLSIDDGTSSTWVHQMVRRSCRNRLNVWKAALAVVLLLFVLNLRYWYAFATGPHNFQAAELKEIKDVDSSWNYFARVLGQQSVDLGLKEVSVSRRYGIETHRRVSSYYALLVGDKFLLVKNEGSSSREAEGKLLPIERELEVKLRDANTSDLFYPFYLDSRPFRTPGYIGAILVGGFVVALLVFAWPAWKQLNRPNTNSVLRRLSTWGEVSAVSRAIESELKNNVFRRSRDVTMTRHFLIRSGAFVFQVYRYDMLMWGFMRVTKKSWNFIPIGRSYEAVLILQDGEVSVFGTEDEVKAVLADAVQKVPWAAYGYSEELSRLFAAGRDKFWIIIEKRRADLLASLATRSGQGAP